MDGFVPNVVKYHTDTRESVRIVNKMKNTFIYELRDLCQKYNIIFDFNMDSQKHEFWKDKKFLGDIYWV